MNFRFGRLFALLGVALVLAGADGASRWFVLSPPIVTGQAAAPAVATTPENPSDPPSATPTEGASFPVEELKKIFDTAEAQIIDARSPKEYAEGHIPDAFSLPFEAFQGGEPALLGTLDRTRTTIVYCGGGDCHASKQVGEMLQAYGFKAVRLFEPGYPAWRDAKYETRTGDQP